MSVTMRALLKSPWVFHLSTGSCNNCDIEVLDCLTPGRPEDVLHAVNHLHAWLPNR